MASLLCFDVSEELMAGVEVDIVHQSAASDFESEVQRFAVLVIYGHQVYTIMGGVWAIAKMIFKSWWLGIQVTARSAVIASRYSAWLWLNSGNCQKNK
ncbi:hypothetical protein [Burkholderia lata]|uniref:hypothetical protein n=1 Tax=Burkholderia lata (strain ATCC 17760 / DSM 23089 / LMG 22485 / NCIMB 9086 / R18194 / 383) TaxID=482957 RepID=UPI0015818A99|nr:hypothetical protein [Burkholderia lata]